MSEEEIIKIQYEAIKRLSGGDRTMAMRIVTEAGAHLRDYISTKHPAPVSCDELCTVIENVMREKGN